MPMPPLKSSVKYVRPSSRTAMPKAAGVVTLSINRPLGCVFGWQAGAAVAIETPGVLGGNADCAVGGALSDAHPESQTAVQHRNRPAVGEMRCMGASLEVGDREPCAAAPTQRTLQRCNPRSPTCVG